jgi:hypothetical protein
MPTYICKVKAAGRDYYFEFSTVVDAPVTLGMTRKEFEKHYREEYGNHAFESGEFQNRMKRVEAKGTSSRLHVSAEEVLSANRAGKDETCLTIAQLIDAYCIHTDWADGPNAGCPIRGRASEE